VDDLEALYPTDVKIVREDTIIRIAKRVASKCLLLESYHGFRKEDIMAAEYRIVVSDVKYDSREHEWSCVVRAKDCQGKAETYYFDDYGKMLRVVRR
jgi:hypothetical protein